MGAIARVRHPWLEQLIASPSAEVRALAEGCADVHPLGRAEPGDAAVTLLFGLSADDPAVEAFDDGALGALEFYRKQTPRLRGAAWDRNALAALDLMRAIQRLRPRRTVADLHKRFAYWNNWAENVVVDTGLDLRREYWRALALTQDVASQFGLAPAPLVSVLAGKHLRRRRVAGALRRLLSDRRLAGAAPFAARRGREKHANEEAAAFGLARWAAAQLPSKPRFLREWRVLEGAFPRDPAFWTPLVGRVIGSVEKTSCIIRPSDPGSPFAAAQWWREDVNVGDNVRSKAPGEASPPDASLLDFVLEAMRKARPYRTLQSRIAKLIRPARALCVADGRHFLSCAHRL